MRVVLDPTRKLDYLWLALVGLVPVFWALIIGGWGDVTVDRQAFVVDGADVLHPDAPVLDGQITIHGYGYSRNFLALIVLLPVILWSIRRVMQVMAPISAEWPPPKVPPLVALADEAAQPQVYAAMRRALLAPGLFWTALALALAFQVLDMSYIGKNLFLGGPTSSDLGFSHLHFGVGENGVSWGQSVTLWLLAYVAQFLCVVLAAFIAGWILLHNVFFIRRVYQRRRAKDAHWRVYFRVDLDDPERCFGFRRANDAFNVQIMALVICGVVLLVTRVTHAFRAVELGALPDHVSQFEWHHFFQDTGQVFVPLNWTLAYMAVLLPALVKLLPFLPGLGSVAARSDLKAYLSEFLPPQQWALDGPVHREDLDDLAARFAGNAFWPSGDNRAAWLFTFAYLVFAVTAFTPLLVLGWLNGTWSLVGVIVLFVLGSVGMQRLTHFVFERVLFFVDERLVKLPATGVPSGPPALFRVPREQSEPEVPGADIVLELSRASSGDDPYAFEWDNLTYQRRLDAGVIQQAELAWEGNLQTDLAQVLGAESNAGARARMGAALRAFLLDLEWGPDEGRILAAVEARSTVRITFVAAAAELYALPWELTSVGAAGRALGDMPGVQMLYEWPGVKAAPTNDRLDDRVLFAWSAAGGAVPAKDQRDALADAAQGQRVFEPEVDVLPNASPRALVEKLRAAQEEGRPYTALHLLAHGLPLPEDPQSVGLSLADGDGGMTVVASIDLQARLAPFADSLQRVVLCTCRSGSGRVGAHLGSLAQALHRAGIQSVLAARTPLSTEGATVFTRALYQRVLAPERPTLAAALESARAALREQDHGADALCLQHYGHAHA